jgi:cation diffusion facilitator family transporter
VGSALVAKELLYRYMLAVGKGVQSTLLTAIAWHARSDAASSLVVAAGIVGNLAGFSALDTAAAAIVGAMVSTLGWEFGSNALHDLMDRAVDAQELAAIRRTLLQTAGVAGVHDLRSRIMGDRIVIDAHLEVDPHLRVRAAHDIAVEARRRVLQAHRVLDVMTHIEPYEGPAFDPRRSTEASPSGIVLKRLR